MAGTAYADDQITLPPPNQAFYTLFDFGIGRRLIAFDGFTVWTQNTATSPFHAIGTIPSAYLGKMDPAFIHLSPDGSRLIIGAGAGGFAFPDPTANGNIFAMPMTGGTATLIAQLPFHVEAGWKDDTHLAIAVAPEDADAVVLLDITTGVSVPLVANLPDYPGGVNFDGLGRLFVGVASGTYVGQIRRFSAAAVASALSTGVPIDFNSGTVIATNQLSAGSLVFGRFGGLFVGGGQIFPLNLSETGFFERINPATGAVLSRFDPVDHNPDDGDQTYWGLRVSRFGCTVGAIDLNISPQITPTVYRTTTCLGDGD
jgi:hypothetical protein